MKKTLIVAGLISAAAIAGAAPAAADEPSVSCSPVPLCTINGQMQGWPGQVTDFFTNQPKQWQGNVQDFFTNQPKQWQGNVKDFYTNQPKEFAKNVPTLGAYGIKKAADEAAAENGDG
jgi:hypothetical protein